LNDRLYEKVRGRLEHEAGLVSIVAHENPDGDAVGSALALHLFLRKKGKRTVPVCATRIPPRYDFLPGFSDFTGQLPGETSLVVIIDAPDTGRAGLSWEGPVIRIDHHEEGIINDLGLLDTAAASTGNILLDFLRHWDESAIDPGIATCLYAAVFTDTNSFNIRTDARVLRDAAWLLERGVDGHRVADLIYRRRTWAYLRLLGLALSGISLEMDGAFALMVLRREDFKATGARGHEAENLVEFPFSVEGVRIAAKVQQDGERWRVSLRSRGAASAEAVAKALGGGGHKHAAGAVVPGELAEVIAKLRAAVEKELAG
jgi:phosphoesterase RecJ-like protein